MRLPSVNRIQRGILLLAAAVIALVQLSYFNDNGIEGYGWVLSVLVITLFCLLAFNSPSQAPQFRVAWYDSRDANTPANLSQAVARNLSAVLRAADSLSALVTARMSDIQTNRGPFSTVTGSLIRSSLLMYSLGLLAICKLRHNGDFLQSDEYLRTKAAVANAASEADNLILKDAPGRSVVPESYDADFREIEAGVRAFFRALASHDVRAPTKHLNEWLNERARVQGVVSTSMDKVAKEEMRKMYSYLFGSDPTVAVSQAR